MNKRYFLKMTFSSVNQEMEETNNIHKRKSDQEDGSQPKKIKLDATIVDPLHADAIKPNFTNMKVKQLKEECRKKGLRVSGTRAELMERLTTGVNLPSSRKSSSKKAPNMTGKTNTKGVESRLEALHVENVKKVSNCLKKGIQLGYVNLVGHNPLENVVIEGKCSSCNEPLRATVRDLLYQPDYAGLDYEDGGQDAPVKCSKCESGNYVTNICYGKPEFDSGKFHNHCTQCAGFGKCIGDYREQHCTKCGKHYFAGLSGFACDNCKRKRGGMMFGNDSDDSGDDGGEEGCCIA